MRGTMKFRIQREILLPKIQFINSIVPVRNPMPILTNILLEADESTGTIQLFATDLEVSALAEIECDIEQGGKMAIPAKNIAEIIRFLPDEEIQFSSKDNFCLINCLQSKFKLNCADPEDFPIPPQRDWEQSFTMDAGLFSKMIEKTSFAVSEQIGRPAFSGILWELEDDLQKMVATDGKRLAKYETKLPIKTGKKSVIMPVKGANLIRRIINEEEKDLRVLTEESSISFDYNGYKIFSRLIEANYPDYEAVIPYNNSKTVEINVDTFTNAIRRVSLLASEDTYRIILNFSKEQLEINSEDVEKGSADEIVPLDSSQNIDKFQIGFNYKYLLEILNLIDTELVQIKFENTLDPAIFYNTEYPEGNHNLFLLMPLRLSID
jgi:DNA polymerase-3 subunit beta